MNTFQVTETSLPTPALIAFLVVGLALTVFMIAALWRVFRKAGRPGWAAIIPIYNLYVLCRIAGRPGWWWVLYIVPLVDVVISIMVAVGVAKRFGKSAAFGFFLLWLLPIIGYPVLGFGRARYVRG